MKTSNKHPDLESNTVNYPKKNYEVGSKRLILARISLIVGTLSLLISILIYSHHLPSVNKNPLDIIETTTTQLNPADLTKKNKARELEQNQFDPIFKPDKRKKEKKESSRQKTNPDKIKLDSKSVEKEFLLIAPCIPKNIKSNNGTRIGKKNGNYVSLFAKTTEVEVICECANNIYTAKFNKSNSKFITEEYFKTDA